jgi:CarD family transcriptional regulator
MPAFAAVFMRSEESETTLMAQKQKVKVVATAGGKASAKSSAVQSPSNAASSPARAPAAKKAPGKLPVNATKAKNVSLPVGARLKTAAVKSPELTPKDNAMNKTVKAVAAKPNKGVVAKPEAVQGAGAKPATAKSKTSAKDALVGLRAAAAKPAVLARSPEPVAAAVQRAVPAAVDKPAGQKITAPAPVAAAAVVAAPAPATTPKALAEKAAAARGLHATQKKPISARHGFKTNEFVVYPAHGVGRIVGIEEQEIAGMTLELFVITFDKEKLTLRVPTGKLASIGMRKLAEESVVKRAMETLKGRARVKRTMWSRRAQEYVAKINSGDLISIAEVVRDLFRSDAQPEQSYSERQLYENALERMARELAVVERLDERGAVQRIVEILSKSAKGRRLAAETAEVADSDTKAA